MSERLVKIMIMFDLRLSPVGLQLHSLGSGSEEPAVRIAPGHESPG
jgi:hypothetical protein